MQLDWQRNFHRIPPDEKEKGKKGTPYPDQNGVYVISELVDDVKVARYVGKGNIKENMARHKSDDEQNSKLKDLMQNRTFQYRVDFALIENDMDMDNAEYTLFKHYGGLDKLYNEITPSGEWDNTVTPPF